MIYASWNGYKEIVEYLVSKGADLNIKDKKGKKAIDYAIENNNTENKNILENPMKSNKYEN